MLVSPLAPQLSPLAPGGRELERGGKKEPDAVLCASKCREGENNITKPNLTNRAKVLRQSETQPEQIIWSWLRAKKLNGVKFRRQEPVGIYIVDFVSFEKKLIIEIDGGQHNVEENKANGEARTQWLESQGFRVIRFWNNEVSSNLDGVVAQIREALGVSPSP